MAHDVPLRLRILMALSDLLKTISVANGYKTDINGAVFRGRDMFGDGDPLPLLSILEIPVPFEFIEVPRGSAAAAGEWGLLIQGFVPDDPTNPTDPAHYLMADVKRALATEKRRASGQNSNGIFDMGGRVEDIIISSGSVRPPDQLSAVAYFWIHVTLKIVEDNSDAYV